MQFEARMTRQPAFNDRMLMGGVIIQNDVDVLAQRNFAVDLLEKFQPLAVGVFLGGVSDDFAMQIIQRGKEGDCAVAVVIVGLGADMPFAQRQTCKRAAYRRSWMSITSGRRKIAPWHDGAPIPSTKWTVAVGLAFRRCFLEGSLRCRSLILALLTAPSIIVRCNAKIKRKMRGC